MSFDLIGVGFKYLAISEKFEEISEGMKAPEYILIVTKDDKGILTSAKVEKVQNNMTLKGLCRVWGVEDKAFEPTEKLGG